MSNPRLLVELITENDPENFGLYILIRNYSIY
jgi:hypothetical protein